MTTALSAKPKRIAYIDWLRGFACLMMFQTHCYDSWLGGSARDSGFFKWSQLGGTLPAPLFLFLAGISFALVTSKLRERGASPNDIARTTILRGSEIFGFGLLFRLQEFLLGRPYAPWTDLLRVDILNVIGVSLMMMGVACRLSAALNNQDVPSLRKVTIVTAIASVVGVAALTPMLWTVWRPRWLPWWLESYVNGIHTFKSPQPWLFPIFPWTAFAFAGLGGGMLLLSDWSRQHEAAALALAGASGAGLVAVGLALDRSPVQLYPVYDFWHTSPNFFLIRAGILLVILFAAYAWCRWGAGERGFSPLVEMGKCSLLVYWVHIEFVYGRFSIVPKRSVGVGVASVGLLAVFVAMTLLATLRNRFPRWKPEPIARPAGQVRA